MQNVRISLPHVLMYIIQHKLTNVSFQTFKIFDLYFKIMCVTNVTFCNMFLPIIVDIDLNFF